MSGGRFEYAYIKVSNLMESLPKDMERIEKISEVIEELMHDVEWVESDDRSWDTEMAARWWQKLRNLCCYMCGKEENSVMVPPSAPVHYPDNKPYCRFCGASKKDWRLKNVEK